MQKPSRDDLRKAVVVAASCVISFLTYGTMRLSGQLFLASRERFNVGRREAALPFVLCFTMRNISGPFVGYLGNKLGLLFVTVLGCVVSAISLGACFFVEDIITFTVLWGVFLGTGCGMGCTLITNILHVCFVTNFNKMQGIFVSSGSIGSFVLPGITEYLLETYGTSGTFLILSGFLLHCIPVTMLLKEPKTPTPIKIQSVIKELDDANQEYIKRKSISIEDNSNFEIREVTTQQNFQNKYNSSGTKNKEIVQFSDLPKDYTAQGAIKIEICDRSSNVTKDSNLSDKNVFKKVEDITTLTTKVNINKEHKKNIFVSDTESQKDIPDPENHSHSKDRKTNANDMIKLHRPSNSKSRNFQVCLDPAYILILFSLSSATVVVTTMYTVIVDACRDKGITEDVTVLMTFAIAEMLGRLIFGFIADGSCFSPLNIYALCCGCCGLLMIGFVWLDNFYIVLILIAIIGALMGGIIVGPPGVIRNYIKEEDITMAFSSRYFLFGLLNIPQPLVIGYFRETLQSYAGLFYLLGSMCLMSTIIARIIPSAARFRDRKKS